MINQDLQQGLHSDFQNGSAVQDQSKQNQGSCQQKQLKKSSEGSVHTINSISTSNKIAYDNSIDEFSRQQIPSENDMSKGLIKQNNQNLNKHLKAIPEMSPFKSLADKNMPVQSQQPRKFQYAKINNNSICIEKLEFKINQPKKDQLGQQSKGVLANQIFLNQNVAFSHSTENYSQLKQLDKFSPQNRLNFYNTSQRRQTAQEFIKAQGQRATISESPKKSFRYSKIFNSQPYTKDNSNNTSQPQLNNNNSLASLNNNRSNIQYNTTNRNGSLESENLKNKECVYIVRQRQISEQKDNSSIQSVAQKVIEITKNQQEYLQNMQKQYSSNQSINFNQSYLQFPTIQQQQQQQQQQQYLLQGQQQQGQLFINSNTPKKQIFIQNQQVQQIPNLTPQQQNFSYQPTRNLSFQSIFVPQQQNFTNLMLQQQQQQQQLNQFHLINNQNLFQALNVNRSYSQVGQEQPQRSFSTGQNPYFIQQRRIFTENSQRDFSPQFSGKANSLKLTQGKTQQFEAINKKQIQKQLSTSNECINQQENSNQKQILLLNQEIQNKNDLNQMHRQTIGSSIRSSVKTQDISKQAEQFQNFSQGQTPVMNDENKNRDTVSSLNSFGNPTKFTVIGQGIGARFSFCKNQGSQQDIQSSQLQEQNILKEKNQDKKSEPTNLKKQNAFQNENKSNVPQQKGNLKENEEINLTNQITEKSTAAGLTTIQSDFDQLNTKGAFINNYQSLKVQNETSKLSCDRSSQRKSLTSGPVSSIYSPLKNYFKESNLQQKQNMLQLNEDQVPITPVSMMQQNKAEQQNNILKMQNNREEAADPLEMYPSQYDPNENLQRENRLLSFKKQDLNKASDKNLRMTTTDEQDQNNNQFQSNNSIFQVQLQRNSSSGKKFSLNKLKQIITSDTKNAECSQYIDQYTNSKNKELIEKHKSRIQRIYNTTMTNTSADNHFYDRILSSFEKNSAMARNTDNRYSHSVSRNYSSWNPFYIQENNQANQSFDRSNKIVQIQQIFQNQGQNLSLTPVNLSLNNNNVNNNNFIKESSINVKPFTVSSFQATPINKQQENRDNNSFLVQEYSSQTKTMLGLVNQQNSNIFMEKQQALENLPANKMINDPEENKKFQRNMVLSVQPAAKQINEEVESKRTFLESDRQAPPAQLLQTCYSYESKFKPSPKYQQKSNYQSLMQNTQEKQGLNQNISENNIKQFQQDQHFEQNLNLQQIQDKPKENINTLFNRNRSASSGFVYQNANQSNGTYNNYYSEKQITDKQTSPTQDLPITKQLQQKYQQAIHSFNEKQEIFANQLKPKLQNGQGVELNNHIKQGQDSFQSFTFTRKKSATELSKSNINSKNSLNLSVELKKKSLFLPPKPQQQQQPNNNNNTSQSSTLQNQSYEDIKKGQSVQNVDAKNQKNQIFKNPRSIKDSIINGRQTFSQSFEDVKNSELFVQSLSSPLVKLSDICHNKSYTTAYINAKETKFNGQNVSGQRLKTFEDNYDFNQSSNYNSLQLYSHKKQGNSQHSFLDKEIGNKIIQINTDQHILDVNQEEDKENTQESIIKSNKFPLFQEFFSSIQKEYQNNLKENQVLQQRQYNSNLSTQEASYLQSQQCQLKNNSSTSSQGQKMHQYDEVKEANSSKNYSQKSDLICSYSSYQSQQTKQVDSQFIRNEENQVKLVQSSQASIRQNLKAQNLKSYQQSKSCTDNDSSLFNKSSSTIPHNDQSNCKSISDSVLNKIDSNLLKEKPFINSKSNDNSCNQSQLTQQKRQIKQRVFQKEENKFSQIKQQQKDALEAQSQIRTVTNNSFSQSQQRSQMKNQKQNNDSYIHSKDNSVNNIRQNATENNSNNSNKQIYTNNNNSKLNIQQSSNNKINQSTLQQNNVLTNNVQNTQPYGTQSNVPTQHSLQNTSNNISKITDCSNSKLIQIFMANSQLDLLTGGNNSKNKSQLNSKQTKQNENLTKDQSYLNDLLTANQKLAQSIQQQFKQQQEQNHQNSTNLCLNCNKLIPSKDYINHSQVCSIDNNQQQFKNINLKGDDHPNKLNQNDNLNYLHQKQIECNKNLELVKLQAHQKLHSGETFSASRLCLYVNFFIECLNLIIINNQSYKELKSSLNDLTAIMEKIAISGEDDHTEQFLAFAHKGYEIGLQKLGIIKRLK
ncbi:hypothetical protein TTHERM_00794290 (macronuclear) [Tetrahymena thermophila SB210]|uniref:Uncharacterized protein n=1 Tax=Tetrahymena thermophila (strain SB210) TaxID=312017 RepID=Q23W02_TETTS|nr:hypothetical protein TTHERM_00794290 [Tetrahymena thermophila SB210]EAS00703.2 hypothetical protein TTHERM_00794290 [Tetrahymena thermophila SB210]|eukprot:XP_001020948.2 hypothetical protein TTHERM_00794290 [Tetrahymena thermophila SB210]